MSKIEPVAESVAETVELVEWPAAETFEPTPYTCIYIYIKSLAGAIGSDKGPLVWHRCLFVGTSVVFKDRGPKS